MIVNNDFSSGQLSPWVGGGTTGNSDFYVTNGQAVINFARLSNQYTSPSYFQQSVYGQRFQTYTVTADIYVSRGGNTECDLYINGGDTFWSLDGVTVSQYIPVNVNGTLARDMNVFICKSYQWVVL